MTDLMTIINKIKSADKIAIISHINPDGDAVGSSLALAIALRGIGKSVDVYLQDGVPGIYGFLHGSDTVLEEWNHSEYDIAVALDSGDLERLGRCVEVYNSSRIKINIDHHITNTKFGDYSYIETFASSAGEMVYRIIKMSGIDINKEAAECLYVSIATDTGGFRYSNTTSICMQVAADLINCEIDVSELSQKIFDTISLAKVKLMGSAIDSLEMAGEGKIAVMHVSYGQKESFGANLDDFDGIVNIARNINGVEAAAFLVEKSPNEIKVNFRSNSYIDVSEIAKEFSGGGHKRAAGCTIISKSIDEAKSIIMERLLKVIRS